MLERNFFLYKVTKPMQLKCKSYKDCDVLVKRVDEYNFKNLYDWFKR